MANATSSSLNVTSSSLAPLANASHLPLPALLLPLLSSTLSSKAHAKRPAVSGGVTPALRH